MDGGPKMLNDKTKREWREREREKVGKSKNMTRKKWGMN